MLIWHDDDSAPARLASIAAAFRLLAVVVVGLLVLAVLAAGAGRALR